MNDLVNEKEQRKALDWLLVCRSLTVLSLAVASGCWLHGFTKRVLCGSRLVLSIYVRIYIYIHMCIYILYNYVSSGIMDCKFRTLFRSCIVVVIGRDDGLPQFT